MKIITKYQGDVIINRKDIIFFSNGIPGFSHEKEFIILPLQDNIAFSIMQSIHSQELAFVVTNPFNFFKDYEFSLDEQTLEQLELKNDADVQVMVILTLNNPFSKSTANLQGPVIINTKNNMSKQVILNDSKYKTKHPLFEKKPAKLER